MSYSAAYKVDDMRKRIAELEAENERMLVALEQSDWASAQSARAELAAAKRLLRKQQLGWETLKAELAALRADPPAPRTREIYVEQAKRIAELEAELAELRARRCVGCKWYDIEINRLDCNLDIIVDGSTPNAEEFCCIAWEARP